MTEISNTPAENRAETMDSDALDALGEYRHKRDFVDLLRTIAGGRVHTVITDGQAAIVAACRKYNAKGKLVITVDYDPKGFGDDLMMDVQFDVKVKKPEPPAGGGTLFVSRAGALVEHARQQDDLFERRERERVDRTTGEVIRD